MIEMKRTITPRKIQEDVVKKFENSLSTLSVFISAHLEFPQFEDSQIYPVGICCYNYYDDPQPKFNRDPRRIAGYVREKYDNGDRVILLSIEPIGLNKIKFPVFFLENSNRNPVTNSFTIDLSAILTNIKQFQPKLNP
jgi:hypothetical protein